MKTLTVNIKKGGTGKTTFVFTYGEWLGKIIGAKVLLIDLDESQNLTGRYDIKIAPENRVDRIFTKEQLPVVPIEITDKLHLIAGSSMVEELNTSLVLRTNNQMIMTMWFVDNYEMLSSYDYVIIDTHNDYQLVTQNSFVVSDLILGISDPSKDGFEALISLENYLNELKSEVINPMTRESYVEADFKFIGNQILHNTNSSREFVENVREDPNCLGFIQKKELINLANIEMVSVIESYKNGRIESKHNPFINSLFELFGTIKNELDSKGA